MNGWDILLLSLIGAALGAAAFFLFRRRKKGGSSCCGDCASCPGACAFAEKDKNKN